MIKHPDFVMNNIHRLADFRKARGLTKSELAMKLGMSTGSISSYEDFAYPTQERYNKLADFFGWQKWEE